MFFRNLTLFRFAADVAPDPAALAEALDGHRLHPCGPLEMSTRGTVAPFGNGEDAPLVHSMGEFALVCVGSEDKLLPSAVVNQELSRKIQRITEEEARPVSGRERKKLKAEVLDELLPRAFSRPSRLASYLDRKQGWLVIDTSSRKAAENALSTLRDALGSFPAVPLAPQQPPRQLMTQWLTTGELPAGLALGDEVELRDPAGAGGAVVKCRHQALESDEIREHLRNGKQVYQLGLEFDERIGFVLGEDLVIHKLRFFDVVTDELDNLDDESATAENEARFALMTLEVQRLLDKLQTWFGLPRPAGA
ncbi:MAG TPA: recombination-associated protein RdgC [Rhodanobacteraceae bacterium]